MPGKTNDKRAHVLLLLKMGYVTQAEAAVLAGVSRQRISAWVREARIHPRMARKRHIDELMRACA